MIFPPFVAFMATVNGNDVFMTCIPEGKDLASCLEFNPKAEVPSLIARFVVERAEDGDLVHIRSCYKNKYISGKAWSFTTASASKPNEDQRDPKCTLFRVNDVGSHVVTFSHVYSGSELAISIEYMSTQGLAILGNYALRLKVVGFGELIRLPERVIFKGDNAKYLRSRHKEDKMITMPYTPAIFVKNEYNDFESEGRSDRSAHYEITHYNGFIRIKSVKYGQFLRRTSHEHHTDWIMGDSNDTTFSNRDTLFKVIKLGKNVIALRNMGNDKVCCRGTYTQNALAAFEDYVVAQARLIVEEPVDVRYLFAEYRLGDARISSKKLYDYFDPMTSVNTSYKENVTIQESDSYEKTKNTFWHTTTTLTNTASAKVNIKLPALKSLGDLELGVSTQSVQVQHLEEGSSFKEKGTFKYGMVVPPRHKGKIKRFVNQVTYEIPYSYIRTDVYTTGEEARITDKDGVCQGEEHFSADYENEITPLD